MSSQGELVHKTDYLRITYERALSVFAPGLLFLKFFQKFLVSSLHADVWHLHWLGSKLRIRVLIVRDFLNSKVTVERTQAKK